MFLWVLACGRDLNVGSGINQRLMIIFYFNSFQFVIKVVIPEIIIYMQKDNIEKSTAIKVFIRVRPLVGAELGTNEVVEV